MYFFTHLFIAKILYARLSETVPLDFHSFCYGNIKPDLPCADRHHHTLDNYLEHVCSQTSALQTEDHSIQDFSVQLGEICHYVSDFFCYYHLNEHIHNKSLKHFFYEISLHLSLLPYRLRLEYPFTLPSLFVAKDIKATVTTMRDLYDLHPKSRKKDIEYALSTSTLICELIFEHIYVPAYNTSDAEITNVNLCIKRGSQF